MRHITLIRSLAGAVVGGLVLLGLAAVPASAGVGNTGAFQSVSCPTATMCVAVDASGDVATSTNPSGGAKAWKVFNVSGTELLGVSCDRSGGSTLCAAINSGGDVITSTNPTGGAGAWHSHVADSGGFMTGISCPTINLCVAVDSAGHAITSTNPTGGVWHKKLIQPASGLNAVSCASTQLCVAVDFQGDAEASTNPTGQAWGSPQNIDPSGVLSVDCPTVNMCVAGDAAGKFLSSTNPGNHQWSTAALVDSDVNGGRRMVDVSCSSVHLCAFVDVTAAPVAGPGNIATASNPVSGPWSVAGGVDAHNIIGISCPTDQLCVGGDIGGGIIASTNPIGGGSTWHRAQLEFQPSNTQITHSTITPARHKASFQFKSVGPATGFQCALKKGSATAHFSVCSSPKTYTGLAAGNYTFLVRAVDTAGPDPSPAKKTFTI